MLVRLATFPCHVHRYLIFFRQNLPALIPALAPVVRARKCMREGVKVKHPSNWHWLLLQIYPPRYCVACMIPLCAVASGAVDPGNVFSFAGALSTAAQHETLVLHQRCLDAISCHRNGPHRRRGLASFRLPHHYSKCDFCMSREWS